MTPTSKPVRRVSLGEFRFGGRPRRLVAQLGPGDVLTLRESRRRYTVALPLDDLYRLGVRTRVNAEKAARMQARRGAHGGRPGAPRLEFPAPGA